MCRLLSAYNASVKTTGNRGKGNHFIFIYSSKLLHDSKAKLSHIQIRVSLSQLSLRKQGKIPRTPKYSNLLLGYPFQ